MNPRLVLIEKLFLLPNFTQSKFFSTLRSPVKPPKVNNEINPNENSIGVFKIRLPPQIVASHEKILHAVGIAIIEVAEVK